MNEYLNPEGTRKVEEALDAVFSAPQPSEMFVDRLESKLQARQHRETPVRRTFRQQLSGFWGKHRALSTATGLLLVLTILLLAVGPDRVAAQVRALLKYIPGIGFVDSDSVRVLAEPVVYTEDGVTFTVTNAVVDAKHTRIRFEIDGWPTLLEMQKELEGQNTEPELAARLYLPDGKTVDHFSGGFGTMGKDASLYYGDLICAPLPAGVDKLTMELIAIPGVPAERMPDGWRAELRLVKAEDVPELPVIEYAPAQVETRPAAPEELPSMAEEAQEAEPAEAANSVQLEVLGIVRVESETALRVAVHSADPDWQLMGDFLPAKLVDDQGRSYEQVYLPYPQAEGEAGVIVLTFEPVAPDARWVTLSIEYLTAHLPLEGVSTVLDLPEGYAVGDTIPMDQSFEIAGLPVHLSGVSVEEDQSPMASDPPMILFNLIFDPVPVVDGLGLTSLMYTLDDPVPQVVGGGGGGGGGGDNTEPPESTNIDISIGISPSGPLPEVLALSFTRASLINYNAKASVTVELTPAP